MRILDQLSIIETDGAVRTVVVQNTTVIGRDGDSDIVLDEITVSRSHALLLPDADGLRLIDLQSSNGTLVNGVPAPPDEPLRLKDGDSIQFGRVLVHYNNVLGA